MEYANIVFINGYEDTLASKMLDNLGSIEVDNAEDIAMEYLKNWDYGEYHDVSSEPPYGSSDYLYEKDGYILSYSLKLDYMGLCLKIENYKESILELFDDLTCNGATICQAVESMCNESPYSYADIEKTLVDFYTTDDEIIAYFE